MVSLPRSSPGVYPRDLAFQFLKQVVSEDPLDNGGIDQPVLGCECDTAMVVTHRFPEHQAWRVAVVAVGW